MNTILSETKYMPRKKNYKEPVGLEKLRKPGKPGKMETLKTWIKPGQRRKLG